MADDSSHTGSVLQDLTYRISDATVRIIVPRAFILLRKFPEELPRLETGNGSGSATSSVWARDGSTSLVVDFGVPAEKSGTTTKSFGAFCSNLQGSTSLSVIFTST